MKRKAAPIDMEFSRNAALGFNWKFIDNRQCNLTDIKWSENKFHMEFKIKNPCSEIEQNNKLTNIDFFLMGKPLTLDCIVLHHQFKLLLCFKLDSFNWSKTHLLAEVFHNNKERGRMKKVRKRRGKDNRQTNSKWKWLNAISKTLKYCVLTPKYYRDWHFINRTE